MTEIHTDRLVLRPVAESDAERLLEFWNLPEVRRWVLRGEYSLSDMTMMLRRSASRPNDHTQAVLLGGVVIGTVNLELVDGYLQPGGPTQTVGDVGYTFDPAYGGQGHATEATRAVVDHAFDSLGVRRVTAGLFADNLPSVRLLERLGMRREQHGVRDSWHAELGWVDGYTYALLADERP